MMKPMNAILAALMIALTAQAFVPNAAAACVQPDTLCPGTNDNGCPVYVRSGDEYTGVVCIYSGGGVVNMCAIATHDPSDFTGIGCVKVLENDCLVGVSLDANGQDYDNWEFFVCGL